MKGKIRIFLSVLLFSTGCQGLLYAGTTGKITGTVTDAETGEPLLGANVIIQGTTMGGACDRDGRYVILNIPPGAYTIMVSMIGYQKVQFENVRVRIDLTTTIDADLNTMALELDEIVVVTAERELVIKDMTSSLLTTSADQIENLPVQSISEVLRLNAGIIESDGRLHIRGGRPGEVAYWVDGVSTTDVYDGRIGMTVENSAIQELQVISGTFNAEYGQAMSGIVNIITKEGGRKYSGQIKLYGGDYVSNDDKYSVYKSLVTEQDPNSTEGLARIVSSERENPLGKFNPIYNGEFSLSGPVPLLGDRLTFFTNGRFFSDEGYFYGANWFRSNGAPGDSSIVALNPYERIALQGKLNLRLSNSITAKYNLFWNSSNRDRSYWRRNSADYQFNPTGEGGFSQFTVHDYKYVPYGLPQYLSEGITHIFTLTHVLSPTTFYELRASRYHWESKQYVYEDPNTSIAYLVSVDENENAGIAAEIFDPDTGKGQTKLQNIVAQGGTYEYIADSNGPDGYIDPSDINAPTSYSFMNQGMDVTNVNRSTAYWVGKFDFTSQVNRANELKFGAEFRLHELELHAFQIVPKTNEAGQEITPFLPAVPEVGNIYRNDYVREPTELSAYIQDKLEFNNIIVNVGLRYDYFDANSVVPTDPTDPNIYFPFKNSNKYANWVDMPADYTGTADQYIQEKLNSGEIREYTSDERRSFMHKEIDPKMGLSPRLGIAFPITERGVIHFSYGHFIQIPEFQYLYTNPDFKITSGTGTALFGNADLKPQKTVMYELGLQQQLTEDIGIDLTLFYRDVRDWVGTSPVIKTVKTGVFYSVFENKDYSNVKGVTLKVEKRFSNNYSFRVDYTYQSTEGTYSSPADAYNAYLRNRSPVLALVPMNWDQKHTTNAQIIYEISDWTLSLIGRYWSGRPYTPSFPVTEAVGGSAVSGLTINSGRRPPQKSVDLTINRKIRLGSDFRFEVFVNIYNLLDQRDGTSVYGDTGSPDYTTTINLSKIPYNSDRVSTVEEYVLQPGWYTAPRQIQVGLIFGFN